MLSLERGGNVGVELPAGRPLDAVRNGQVPPLGRLKVICAVRVERGEDRAVKAADLLHDGRNDRLRLGRAERTVDKVLLHVHNN